MLPITSILAALYALMMVALSLLVSLRRRNLWVVHGDANDDILRRRIRAHGNFIEYAPMALLIVALLEYRGSPNLLIGGLALCFLVSRLLHAYGMLYGKSPAERAFGMMLQHAGFVAAALYLIASMFALV